MIAADKLQHLKVGALVAAFSAILWLALSYFGAAKVSDLGPAVALSCLVAGLTKEGADWLDNKAAAAAGRLQVHGVEFMDATFTAAPGFILWLILYGFHNRIGH